MKRLIICADGTWNSPDRRDREKPRKHRSCCEWIRKPSNVVKMARAILPKASDGTFQVVFYDPGVGTGWGIVDPVMGGAVGQGLSKNILDGYRFLVHNYDDGDELFFFGFSRGAFTVRSLAGFIQKCGLLPKKNCYWIPEAYEHYRLEDNEENRANIERFHSMNNVRKVKIKFIGVWDTVGSLGIPFDGIIGRQLNNQYAFHNVDLGEDVENAYHALAIDERRKPFKPTLWKVKGVPGQKVAQVWFAGVHTNVGGGCDPDGLANCAFQWMLEKAELNGHGLEFDKEYASYFKAHPTSALRDSMSWYYRLLGEYLRPIGEMENGHESVHPSAATRLEAEPPPKLEDGGPYKPPNLLAYLNKVKQEKPSQ